MQVSKETAVAVCQDYGFSTADGWGESRLAKKLTELVQLHRSGEFEPEDAELEDVLNRLAEAAKAGEPIEFAGESAESVKPERTAGGDEADAEVIGCPLGVGDRVIIHDPEEDWKGIVDELLTPDRVMIRDRRQETWEMAVEKCELVKRAADVQQKQRPAETALGKPAERSKGRTPEDEEIRSLQERLQALKEKKRDTGKSSRSKRLKRDELAVKTLRAHPEGGVLGQLAEELDLRWQKQGKQSNLRSANNLMKRLVGMGVLFGLLKLEGKRVTWLSSE